MEIFKNVLSLIVPQPIVENFFGGDTNNYDDESKCNDLKIEYPNTAAVSSLDINKVGPEKIIKYTNNRKTTEEVSRRLSDYALRDFYIKTSYNCCAVGGFKKDYVDLCALRNGIKQGCRCLDFEIYSLNNQPVIATSSAKTNFIKESRNYIPFIKAMRVVAEESFNVPSPCPFDPILLHFRIKSENKEIYGKIASTINNVFSKNRLLHKKYGREYKDKNLGDVPIGKLQGKVIICVDKTNSVFEDTSLDKLVNICSNSMFMRLHRNYDVTYVQDFKELIDYNKTAMSLVLPDISANPDNVNPTIPLKYGCHMVAMNLQNNDDNMKYYTKFFNDYGTSFVLKEKKLRKIDKIIKLPPLQDPNLSYRDREVKDEHYDLRI